MVHKYITKMGWLSRFYKRNLYMIIYGFFICSIIFLSIYIYRNNNSETFTNQSTSRKIYPIGFSFPQEKIINTMIKRYDLVIVECLTRQEMEKKIMELMEKWIQQEQPKENM